MIEGGFTAGEQYQIDRYVRNAVGDELAKLSGVSCVSEDDLFVGEKLGQGGFADVRALRLPAAPQKPDKYALKKIRDDLPQDVRVRAAADLLIEAALLSGVRHPNIIELKEMSRHPNHQNPIYSPLFLVIERLSETLEQRIRRWNSADNSQNGLSKNSILKDMGNKVALHASEKLRIIKSLASGLAFMHEHKVIHRDIKPDNIGFAQEDDALKIFDFGVSRRLPGDKVDKAYKMSGLVGSRRYMAPEVMQGKNYGVSADAYAWGIVAAETLTQKKSFVGVSSKDHAQAVCHAKARPSCGELPKPLRKLVKTAWHPWPRCRPPLSRIFAKLERFSVSQSQAHNALNATKLVSTKPTII